MVSSTSKMCVRKPSHLGTKASQKLLAANSFCDFGANEKRFGIASREPTPIRLIELLLSMIVAAIKSFVKPIADKGTEFSTGDDLCQAVSFWVCTGCLNEELDHFLFRYTRCFRSQSSGGNLFPLEAAEYGLEMQFIENTGYSSSKIRVRMQGKPHFHCLLVQNNPMNPNLFNMKAPTLSTFFLALTLVFWGCSDGDDSLKTTGRLNVFLVDEPFPTDQVAEANVVVFKVDARLSDPEFREGSESMEEGDSQGGFIPLMEGSTGPLNLLDLVNGVSEQLVGLEVPAGTYDLIRVYVSDPQIVMSDENQTTYSLKVPSGAQSGIKVFLDPPLQVVGGLTSELTLDFDVSQSFVPKGGSEMNPDGISGFNFTPVIRAGITSTTGTLAGMVTDESEAPIPGATISIYALDDTLITGTTTDETGGYSMPGIDPGIYRLEASAPGFEVQSVDEVAVFVANKTTQDFTLVAMQTDPGE